VEANVNTSLKQIRSMATDFNILESKLYKTRFSKRKRPDQLMKLKQSIFAVLTLILLASCAGTPAPVDCKQYKNGKFRFSAVIDDKRVHYVIERSNDTQIEHSVESGTVATYKINWKDDCAYQLVYLHETASLPEQELKMKRKMVVQTTILSGTKDYYVFEASNNLFDKVMKDTMWVAK
jgi:hypothetical protein